MRPKRNPIKQIMSDVHKDARSGKVDLGGHEGFIAEVKRRARSAGFPDEEIHEIASRQRHDGPERPDGPPDPAA